MAMVETKFKQTDIGLIPEDWEVKYVKDFTDCTAGGTPSTKMDEYWNGDIPWMNSGELNKRRIYNTHNFITKRGLENSSTKIIPENCVLIGLAGQGKTRGTVAINKISLSINQSIGAFYANSVYNSSYLFFNLQNRYEELRNLSSGDGGRGGLNLHILKSLQVPLPPLPEQQAIAKVLSDTDAWIESLEQLIAKKQLIKQGAMQELLTPDPSTSSGDWEVKKLGEVCESVASGISNTLNNGNIYPIQGSTGIIGFKNYFDYEGENLTVARVGANAGYVRIISGKYCVSDNTLLVITKAKELTISFLFYFLKNRSLNQLVFGSGQPLITGGQLKDIDIHLPSLSEQTRIATILSDMDAELEALAQKLSKARQIKQGMMQELLTGKIRLTLNN